MITVCLNAEAYIEKTVTSVLNQTIPVYEYILIDGKSDDQTNQIIENYRNYFEKKGIRYIHVSEKDAGISDAFNKGIRLSTGDVIGLINANDELISNTNDILNSYYDSATDVWYGNCKWIDLENGIEYERKARPERLSRIRYEMVLIHPSTFINRAAYDHYGLYNTNYKYCMDEELLTRFYEHGASFKYIDQKLTIFKAGGISDKGIKKTLEEGLKLALDIPNSTKYKAYCSYIYKYFRYKISSWMKRKGVYKIVKRDLEKFM